MRNKLQKKYQKGLNKIIRELNKNIMEDNLWKSRFVFHIMATEFEEFEDKSGGVLYCILRGYDKATKKYNDYRIEYAPYLSGHSNYKIWVIGNKFITEDSGAWTVENNPYEDKTDYRKIKVNDKVWDFRYNPFTHFCKEVSNE